ncbi:acyl carrier protein [Paenibacillus sp. SYP-B4298]|uniref:acyl carrier protein n=1 Tax=Paenibacillus sp. SYP-B4298 TaxID=2996034 RepID=UPI0022DD294C|nr:acyl carrier protein [Paenibacillus sp. SYP-B4298]
MEKKTAYSLEDIQQLLIDKIAELAEIAPDSIHPAEPFASYGLDSLLAVTFVGDLEDWFELRLPATLLWDYPSIQSLSGYLYTELSMLTAN